jgi:ORF6N domain
MPNPPAATILPASTISQKIYFLRKTRVMLDSDLAQLYDVTTSNLNLAVRRNRNRFPKDFMFQLTKKDAGVLRLQFAISNKTGRGGRRYRPYVFTEHGVAMLSSILHSDRAVQVNIAIMRAFLQLRAMLATHEDLRRKIMEMEKRYDSKFHAVFATLRQMLETPIPTKRQIGFHSRTRPS